MRVAVAGLAFWIACSGCKQDQRGEEVDWELQRHYQFGNQALGEGSLTTAEHEYRQVLQIDSAHVGALHKLARTLMSGSGSVEEQARRDALGEAVALLEKAARLDPGDLPVAKDLARAYHLSGRAQQALQAYARLLELNRADCESRLRMADIHEQKGETAEADRVYLQGFGHCPDLGGLQLAYGRFLVRQKRDPDAKKQFLAVSSKSPLYYEALDELGAMAAREGDHSEVRRIYQQLVEMNPNDYMAWELLAALDENQKKFSEAEQKYRRSLQVDRMHLSAWLGLGRTLRLQDRLDEAVYALKKADGFLAASPERALELAEELLALGDSAWAASVLDRARIVAADPEQLRAIEEKLAQIRAKKTP